MGVKPAPPKNMPINMRPNIRRDWAEARQGANDGLGQK